MAQIARVRGGMPVNMYCRFIIDPSDFMRTNLAIEKQTGLQMGVALVQAGEMMLEVTKPYVPYKNTDGVNLEDGGSIGLLSGYPMGELQIQYDAFNERDGYNYAAIQHDGDFNHPVRKAGKRPQRLFLAKGLIEGRSIYEGIITEKFREGLMMYGLRR